MTEDSHGGDISSGFGESQVDGPVSDEKAEQMLHDDPAEGEDVDENGQPSTEPPASH